MSEIVTRIHHLNPVEVVLKNAVNCAEFLGDGLV